MDRRTPRGRVLVVERSTATRRALRPGLEAVGLTVIEAATVDEALRRVSGSGLALVVVAPRLPEASGLEIVRRVREATPVPILLLGVHDARAPIGAVMAVLASGPAGGPVRRFGELHIDVPARTVTVAGREVHLTRKEMDLLLVLSSRAGSVCTRDELLNAVWASPQLHDSATLSEHVHRLRRKIQEQASGPSPIQTVRGVGYRFVG